MNDYYLERNEQIYKIEKIVGFSVEISDAINPYDNRSIYIIKKGRKK